LPEKLCVYVLTLPGRRCNIVSISKTNKTEGEPDMTSTAAQAATDVATYITWLQNHSNKAAAARELGIGASTVAERVKRHLARADAAAAAQTAAAAAQTAAAEPAPVVAAGHYARNTVTGRNVFVLENSPEHGTVKVRHLDGTECWGYPYAFVSLTEDEELAAALDWSIAAGIVIEITDAAQLDKLTAGETEAAQPAECVTECVTCGFHFSRPQRRRTCQSAAACLRRQVAAVAALALALAS
jgi:hypothetical protein